MPDTPTRAPINSPLVHRVLRALGVLAFVVASFIVLVLLASSRDTSLLQKFWMIAGWLLAAGAVAISYLAALRARGQPQAVPAIVIFDAVSFLTGGLLVVSFWSGPDPRTWAATIIWSFAFIAMGGVTGFLFGVPRSRREVQRTVMMRSPAPPPPVAIAVASTQPATDAAGTPGVAVNPVVATNPAAPNAATTADATTAPVNAATQADAGGAVLDTAAMPPPGDFRSSDGDASPIEQISDWLTKIIVGLGLVNLKALPPRLVDLAFYVSQSITPPGTPPAAGSSFALGLIIYFSIFGFMGCYILTQMFLLDFVNRLRAN